MSYAIVAGVIFAWAVVIAWAALEVRDARKPKELTLKQAHDAFWGAFK